MAELRPANHDFLRSGGGIILDALRLALSLSIVPFSNPIDPADALRFALSFPFFMSILPLILAEPVSFCGIPAGNRLRSIAPPDISSVAALRRHWLLADG